MHRLPVVAVIGRPNVGKSTLFNRLIGSRRAVVDDTPGVTRDRLYGQGEAFGREFRVVDTGGLDAAFGDDISAAAQMQTRIAIDEADVIVFVLDGQEGVSSVDHEVADGLRKSGKPVILVANKLESLKLGQLDAIWDLRLGEALPISALHGTQVGDLLERLHELLPDTPEEDEPDDEAVRVAVVGRPNVGKSSLINAILGEERLVVADRPGTTRDAVDTAFERDGQPYVLVDTAGIRRKAKVTEALEYYCVLRAMDAIERSHVAVLVLDARDGFTDQDKRIAGIAHEAGRGLILAVNKWDLFLTYLDDREKSGIEIGEEIDRRVYRATRRTATREYAKALRDIVPFCAYAPVIFTAAIHRDGVAKVLAETNLVAEHHAFRIPTAELNDVL
ncbi:MAG: ribosome biogenesis GTPase Der, partial [Armatimonadetes bacterium]|nr:ribosome biogenesis GTPase Der [Armatimonadota bacterium]